MKRRKFLKIIGIGAATPTIVVKALAEKPIPLIAGEWSDVMLRARDLLADHYLDKFDKTVPKVLYG